MKHDLMNVVRFLPVDEWPAADRQAWRLALQPHSPFKKGGAGAAKLAPSTQGLIANGYGRYLSWLQEVGRLDTDAKPSDRTCEQNLLDYLEHLNGRNSSFTVAGRIQQLGNAVRIMAPNANHAVILLASYRLRAAATPSRNKRDRVQSCDRTALLGLELLEQATSGKFLTPVMRAKLYRDGLLILFLAYRAPRNANLGSIEVGKQLVLRGDALWLCFEAPHMKGRRDFEVPVPDEHVPYILRYLDEFRPILLARTRKNLPPTNALWISSHGTPMSAAAIGVQVRDRTKVAFGESMTPHFFRDSLATTQANEAPEFIADTSALLAHKSLAVAEKHYNQSNGIKARRRYGEAISRRRLADAD
jgi:integrase/recombinase XerD